MMSAARKHPILLVDDEPEILFSLQGLLRRDFELHIAESGRQALEILQSREIHVLMSDQRMPEMTGVQLMHLVKDAHPSVIRIIFTGYADIRAVIDAINNVGLYRYITKPWDPDELIEVLHQAAARYDDVAARQQLLTDLRAYLLQTQASAAAAALDDLANSGKQLLERLERAIADNRQLR